jgi:hypothetical protein
MYGVISHQTVKLIVATVTVTISHILKVLKRGLQISDRK